MLFTFVIVLLIELLNEVKLGKMAAVNITKIQEL